MSWQEHRHHRFVRTSVMAFVGAISSNAVGETVVPDSLRFPEGDTSLSLLTPEHIRVRDLYNKDCIIYVCVPLDPLERLRLLEAVYFEWFPHRDREQDLDHGSFFASFFTFKPERYDLTQMAIFHFQSLCSKLNELQPEVLEPEPHRWDVNFGKSRQKGLFKIRRSFEKTFLVVDRFSWRDSVRIVTRDQRTVELLRRPSEDFEAGTVGKVTVLRAKLEDAMKAMVAEDDQRSKDNREWSGYYGKWCGGPNEGPPTRYGDVDAGDD